MKITSVWTSSSGGPAILLAPRPEGLQTVSEKDPTPNAKYRRSLCLLARRNYPMEFLQVFDFPVIQVNCTRRINSATPLQSLTMLNDEFMVESGKSLAGRILTTSGEQTPLKWIETAYLLARSRKPASAELKICAEIWKNRNSSTSTPTPNLSKPQKPPWEPSVKG